MTHYGLWRNPLDYPPPQQQNSPNQPPTRPADFHLLYLAPGLSVDYFFGAAKLYWQTFKPIVTHDLVIVQYIPAQYSVAVTSLARSDTAPVVREQIESNYAGRLYHDPLVYDFLDDMQLTLDARANRNQPYGVPLES